MRIESYFDWIRDTIERRPAVRASNLSFDKRSTYQGLIKAELYFRDSSVLHIREYVDVETTVDRLMYVYQYDGPTRDLIFRYDNTGHHKKLALTTHPHHKHAGSEQNVVDSPTPNLKDILDEIDDLTSLVSDQDGV